MRGSGESAAGILRESAPRRRAPPPCGAESHIAAEPTPPRTAFGPIVQVDELFRDVPEPRGLEKTHQPAGGREQPHAPDVVGRSRGAGSDEGGDPRSAPVSCHARRDLARRPLKGASVRLEGDLIPRDYAGNDPSASRNRIRKRGPRNFGTRHSFSTNLVTSLCHSC